jgi:tRNA threonylcarbamoyl adenosine modification protein YeaZ
VESIVLDKKAVSKELTPAIQNLLQSHGLTPFDLAYIAANGGPAPYTSLRITLATANGLHFVCGVPIVCIDAIKTFLHEHQPQAGQATVVLFNAFNQDLFFALQLHGAEPLYGSLNKDLFVAQYAHLIADYEVTWLGNGFEFIREQMASRIKNSLPETVPAYPSQAALLAYAEDAWSKGIITHTALPLYLKQIT